MVMAGWRGDRWWGGVMHRDAHSDVDNGSNTMEDAHVGDMGATSDDSCIGDGRRVQVGLW